MINPDTIPFEWALPIAFVLIVILFVLHFRERALRRRTNANFEKRFARERALRRRTDANFEKGLVRKPELKIMVGGEWKTATPTLLKKHAPQGLFDQAQYDNTKED